MTSGQTAQVKKVVLTAKLQGERDHQAWFKSMVYIVYWAQVIRTVHIPSLHTWLWQSCWREIISQFIYILNKIHRKGMKHHLNSFLNLFFGLFGWGDNGVEYRFIRIIRLTFLGKKIFHDNSILKDHIWWYQLQLVLYKHKVNKAVCFSIASQ